MKKPKIKAWIAVDCDSIPFRDEETQLDVFKRCPAFWEKRYLRRCTIIVEPPRKRGKP